MHILNRDSKAKKGQKIPRRDADPEKNVPLPGRRRGNSPGLRRFGEKSVFTPFSFFNLAKNVRERED